MDDHYSTEEGNRTNDCYKYKHSTSKCSTSKCSTSDSGSINFREVNRGRNIESFYIKEELLEMLIYSICYDDMEKNCHLFKLKKHILSVVTQNDIPKYCKERPHQAFLLHKLLSSFSKTMKDTRNEMVELWKKNLFDYDLIIIS
ncbi:hypothetical protein H8356DRAFT_1294544 [Neocallimastix lanati (nom. inval.)]|nr:hypothetical protein H8356DRAFT_1294544 [Neocallimastix sp. JGI-2020a]